MSEGILLPPVPRGTLLAVSTRIARREEAIPQIRAVLESETDAVGIEATLACLLWETLVQTTWCGFYRRVDERTLVVGPSQGTLGGPADRLRAGGLRRVCADPRGAAGAGCFGGGRSHRLRRSDAVRAGVADRRER